MSNKVDDLGLEHVHALRAEQERIESEVQPVAARPASLETSTAAGRRHGSAGAAWRQAGCRQAVPSSFS